MKINKKYFSLNLLIFSLITTSIFPNSVFRDMLGLSFASTPFLTTIITFYLLLKNPNIFIKINKQTSNIFFFILIIFVITFFQSFIQNNLLIIIRYCFPLFISFFIYQYLLKNYDYRISNVITFIFIFFILLFFIQKFNPLGLNNIFCSIVNEYELIIRGSCGFVNTPTFLSSEPSYHAMSLISLYIFYKLYKPLYEKNEKENHLINILFLINLLIVKSDLAGLFIIIFLNYLFFKKISFNLKNIAFISLLLPILVTTSIQNGYLLEKNFTNEPSFKTIESRFFYNFLAIEKISFIPKNKFLSFRENEIEYLTSNEGFSRIENIPVVKNDIDKGNKFNLNSALIYFLYDFGFFFAIPFIWINITLIKNMFFFNKRNNFFLIFPFYLICFFAQSNFSNILMWLIFFHVAKKK